MTRRSLRTISSLAAVATLTTAGVAGASADDQARLDAAIDAFSTRMVDAGWVSQGPADDDDDDDDDDDIDDDIDDEAVDEGDDDLEPGDEMFAECIGEDLAVIFESDDEIPGATASAESDEFSFAPEADSTATTEAFSFDFTEHTVSALVATIDDENLDDVARFVDVFGEETTGECLTEAFAAEFADDSAESEIPMEFQVDAVTEGDLGVGDRSSSVTMTMAVVFMVPIELEFQFVFALAGNDLVGVVELVSGEPAADFDPVAEAQLIVDDLAA